MSIVRMIQSEIKQHWIDLGCTVTLKNANKIRKKLQLKYHPDKNANTTGEESAIIENELVADNLLEWKKRIESWKTALNRVQAKRSTIPLHRLEEREPMTFQVLDFSSIVQGFSTPAVPASVSASNIVELEDDEQNREEQNGEEQNGESVFMVASDSSTTEEEFRKSDKVDYNHKEDGWMIATVQKQNGTIVSIKLENGMMINVNTIDVRRHMPCCKCFNRTATSNMTCNLPMDHLGNHQTLTGSRTRQAVGTRDCFKDEDKFIMHFMKLIRERVLKTFRCTQKNGYLAKGTETTYISHLSQWLQGEFENYAKLCPLPPLNSAFINNLFTMFHHAGGFIPWASKHMPGRSTTDNGSARSCMALVYSYGQENMQKLFEDALEMSNL